MAKTNTERQKEKKESSKMLVATQEVSSRGRTFEGTVTKKFHKRVVIEFERTVYVKKYERFYRKKTRLHARISDELAKEINVGDYIKIRECRPLSKIIHFIVVEKIRSAEDKK
jgi:small subunit ribosomal protein S17